MIEIYSGQKEDMFLKKFDKKFIDFLCFDDYEMESNTYENYEEEGH